MVDTEKYFQSYVLAERYFWINSLQLWIYMIVGFAKVHLYSGERL